MKLLEPPPYSPSTLDAIARANSTLGAIGSVIPPVEGEMKVSLEWDNSLLWRYPMWYKDPKTHAIEKAFDGSVDFIGRNLKELQIK